MSYNYIICFLFIFFYSTIYGLSKVLLLYLHTSLFYLADLSVVVIIRSLCSSTLIPVSILSSSPYTYTPSTTPIILDTIYTF